MLGSYSSLGSFLLSPYYPLQSGYSTEYSLSYGIQLYPPQSRTTPRARLQKALEEGGNPNPPRASPSPPSRLHPASSLTDKPMLLSSSLTANSTSSTPRLTSSFFILVTCCHWYTTATNTVVKRKSENTIFQDHRLPKRLPPQI